MRRALLTGLLLCSSLAHGAELRVVDQDLDFDEFAELAVEIVVEDAADLAGLEFGVVYPGSILAVAEPTSHVAGDFLGAPTVNHEANTAGLPAGFRRINVALAAAEASGVVSAAVITLRFPLRCSDFGGEWPEGRPFAIELADLTGWTVGAGGLPEVLTVDGVDGSFTVNCTTVDLDLGGFTTLKARFGAAGGQR